MNELFRTMEQLNIQRHTTKTSMRKRDCSCVLQKQMEFHMRNSKRF